MAYKDPANDNAESFVANNSGGGSSTERTIELLLATARDLLIEVGRLHGNPDESWHVGHVTKKERPGLVFPDEYYEDSESRPSPGEDAQTTGRAD